jgi:hypothetical protein
MNEPSDAKGLFTQQLTADIGLGKFGVTESRMDARWRKLLRH